MYNYIVKINNPCDWRNAAFTVRKQGFNISRPPGHPCFRAEGVFLIFYRKRDDYLCHIGEDLKRAAGQII